MYGKCGINNKKKMKGSIMEGQSKTPKSKRFECRMPVNVHEQMLEIKEYLDSKSVATHTMTDCVLMGIQILHKKVVRLRGQEKKGKK